MIYIFFSIIRVHALCQLLPDHVDGKDYVKNFTSAKLDPRIKLCPSPPAIQSFLATNNDGVVQTNLHLTKSPEALLNQSLTQY